MNWSLLWIFAGVIGATFKANGVWFADAAYASVLALVFVLLWVMGKIWQTNEYWYGRVPSWMIWIASKPKDAQIFNIPKRHMNLIPKIFCVLMAIGTVIAHVENEERIFPILFSTVLVIGIILVEVYFRRKYIQLNDDKPEMSIE